MDRSTQASSEAFAVEVGGRFPAQLKLWRKHRNLSQARLASAAGIDLSTLAHAEHGRNVPSLTTTLALAHALGIGIEELLFFLPRHLPGECDDETKGPA